MSYSGLSMTQMQQPMVNPYQPVTNLSAQIANALLKRDLRDRFAPNAQAAQNPGLQLSNNGGFLGNLFSLGAQ
jgi:hypothetical protein